MVEQKTKNEKEINLLNNIKSLRIKKGWNQRQVSSRLKISVPAYSKIEAGITGINMSRLYDFTALYGVSVHQLLNKDCSFLEPGKVDETQRLIELLEQKEAEIFKLQKKLIDLYEIVSEKRDTSSSSV